MELPLPSLWRLIAGVAVASVLYVLFKPLASPLRHVPGPFLARYTRLWLLKEVYLGTYPQTSIRLHKRYGPIVRIAPNEYSIDDPAAAKTIYGSGKGFVKSPWYSASRNPVHAIPNLFAEADPHVHAQDRRKIAAAYSMTNLVQLEPFIDDCTGLLEHRLNELAEANTAMDVSHWMQCYAFDVIGKMTLGKRFGFLDRGEDIQGIMASLHKFFIYGARVGVFPEWHKFLFTRQMQSPKVSGLGHVRQFAYAQFDEKCEAFDTDGGNGVESNTSDDFMTRFLRIQSQDPSKLSNHDIRSVCMMNIGAGSDTTSIGMTSVILHLMKHPEVLDKLREEIRTFELQGELSDPIKFSEAKKMPYLQAVLKEALRMHPATGLSLGRIVPPEGADLAGQYFPPGTVVGINAWVAHANKKVFGSDADTFRPERWLEDAQVVREREAYFMSFGQGSRTCIGKNISLMELSKTIPQIFRRYNLVADTESGEPEYSTENVWFVKIMDLHCRVHKIHV
ncbi:hypothetical protein NLU13_2917 [Sarocladium strictum]|uniref:Pisatin demethylase n=1 Tax=Sarocladium strictum TaxID=5046 RepID=A0AA39L9S0_SARSR|nr:hypothetical protein NLU13_2917 [Sarocladium strictum]